MSPARLDPAGAWRVSRWESPATHYPRRRVGRAAVETYTQAPGYYRFYGLADPAGRRRELYRTTRALPLTQLTVDGETWMVDDPPHLTAVREFAHEYRGHVLCAGLGLGLVAHALLDNPAVAAVTLVERDPDVAALVGPLVAGPRVRVVVADWWGYDPAADPGFAVPVGGVFFDILRGDAGSPVVQAGALRGMVDMQDRFPGVTHRVLGFDNPRLAARAADLRGVRCDATAARLAALTARLWADEQLDAAAAFRGRAAAAPLDPPAPVGA